MCCCASSIACFVCNSSEPTSKLNTLCSHPCRWRCWLHLEGWLSLERSNRGSSEEVVPPPNHPSPLLQKDSFPEADGMAPRVNLPSRGEPKGQTRNNHSSPEMTGILEEWMLHLSLLGKFPTEVLIFLSPVRRRSKSKEGKKEDTVSKFLPKFPLFLP